MLGAFLKKGKYNKSKILGKFIEKACLFIAIINGSRKKEKISRMFEKAVHCIGQVFVGYVLANFVSFK